MLMKKLIKKRKTQTRNSSVSSKRKLKKTRRDLMSTTKELKKSSKIGIL